MIIEYKITLIKERYEQFIVVDKAIPHKLGDNSLDECRIFFFEVNYNFTR